MLELTYFQTIHVTMQATKVIVGDLCQFYHAFKIFFYLLNLISRSQKNYISSHKPSTQLELKSNSYNRSCQELHRAEPYSVENWNLLTARNSEFQIPSLNFTFMFYISDIDTCIQLKTLCSTCSSTTKQHCICCIIFFFLWGQSCEIYEEPQPQIEIEGGGGQNLQRRTLLVNFFQPFFLLPSLIT